MTPWLKPLRSSQIDREHVRALVRSFEPDMGVTTLTSRSLRLDLLLTLITQGELETTDISPIWDAVIDGRALVLDELMARRVVLRGADDPALDELQIEYAELCRQIANLSTSKSGDERDQKLVETREQRTRVERKIAQRSQSFAKARKRDDIDLAAIRDALPEDSALVAFSRYRHERLRSPGELGVVEVGEGSSRYCAFVLSSANTPPMVVPLGSAEELDEIVSRWRSEMMPRAGNSAGAELRAKLWDPIA